MSLPFSTRLAFRQLRHKGLGLIGVFAGVCVAVVLVFAQLGFQNALVDSVLNLGRALKADIVITGPQFETIGYSPPWFARDLIYAAREVEGVSDVRPAHIFIAQTRSVEDGTTLAARFIAFDPARPIFDLPQINDQIPELSLPDAVLVDRRSRQGFETLVKKLKRDGMQTVYLQTANASLAPRFDVRGAFSLGPDFTLPGTFVTSDLNFYRLFQIPPDRISLGLVTLERGASVEAAAAALKKRLGASAQVASKDDFLKAERAYFMYQTPIGIVFMFGVGIGILIGVVFVLGVLHGIIESNLSEYAVLRAMGYGDGFFLALVIQIAAAVAVIAFVPSVLFTLMIYRWAEAATGLTFTLNGGLILIVLAATVSMSIFAVLLAIRKIRSSNPLDLFS